MKDEFDASHSLKKDAALQSGGRDFMDLLKIQYKADYRPRYETMCKFNQEEDLHVAHHS